MKISYRTHEILKKLEDSKLGIIGLYEEDAALQSRNEVIAEMRHNFKQYTPYFSKNVRVITRPFAEAIDMARPKMIADDLFQLENSEYGTIFLPTGITLLYFFSPFSEVLNKHGDHLFFVFRNNVLVGYSRQRADVENGLFCFVSKKILLEQWAMLKENGITDQNGMVNELDSQFSTLIMSILNFIKYAPIETVHLNPHGKSKDMLCKYINDTKFALDILDSKWFTTLVKSDAFKVRGHFRLQPCGEGLKDRKLIWINEFQKEGYTAPARKLSQL